MSLRGAKDALTTMLELASGATMLTLQSSPRVDANPWAARVRCARWLLLLLAAVGPPVPPAALLLLSALLLLLLRWTLLLLLQGWARLLLLQRRGRGRHRQAGRAAPRRGGD